MKKSLGLAMALALVLALGASAQAIVTQSLEVFQSAFGDFADQLASSLTLNASTGANWSDAYIGGFPHFGVGLAVGSAMTGKGSVEPVLQALGITSVPSVLAKVGVPIPAAAAAFKIGLPFLPIDIGLTGGYIPPSLGEKLEGATGVSVDYMNVGIQARVGLVKENLLLPDVSIGLAAIYQEGGVTAPLGLGDTTIVDETINGERWVVTASDPAIDLGWKSMVYDATVQVSKTLLIFRPYVGAGYSIGSSTVTGGIASALGFTRDGATADYSALAGAIETAGGTVPALSALGFNYSADASEPVLRLYGGLSLNILIALDAQVVYVPATESLAMSIGTRFQL